jgi:hypothetical protein
MDECRMTDTKLPVIKRIFNSVSCLQISIEENQKKIVTVSVELAKIDSPSGKVNFNEKIHLQFSEQDLNEFALYLLTVTKDKSFQLGYHGASRDKMLKVTLTDEKINVYMAQKGGKESRYIDLPPSRFVELYACTFTAIALREQISFSDAQTLIQRSASILSRLATSN